MSNNGSFANERASAFDGEYAADPATGGFFHTDFKKHDDLKMMLDSNKDNLKLEAMKRIIGMIAKGRDASMLFPAVVKNVVSKNIEIKKLVYVYLERYAEEQQDLALLSISTFQRALKEPNPLIRAGALRVLSSVRVRMISPIVMLAIKDASSDMSSYVRKTAAHAIPKLYSLDPELKAELITIIQKLLADKTVLVIGSAVMAFTEVCPERVDLIHTVYRKLCALIIDVDEWGQVTIVNMLTRYARMQFADPNREILREPEKPHSDDDSNSDSSMKPGPILDPDHRLLLRSTKPLLQSRNAAVVMAVAQLYHHTAPKSESIWTAKALVRLLRSHIEVQTIVLNTIASISAQNKQMFEPYLKSFFVRTSDPTNIKLLKLEILTNLSSDANISTILRELQTYITNTDKRFVSATIQAIGRCACSISEVTDSCLNGLVLLLSNKDEAVVAESVVVIKRLLQTQAADPKEIITHMARLLDNITVAQARAAILWLLGEHSQKVPLIAPDVLRKLAKTFPDEDDIVKLQVMNLAVKLYITNSEQCTKLFQYILNLARYDQNYDIRDKARFLRHCVLDEDSIFRPSLDKIFLAGKPAPQLQSQFKDYEGLQLGSLSHYIRQRATGYEALPSFPDVPPSGESRNVEPIIIPGENKQPKDKKSDKHFPWELGADSPRDSNGSSSSSNDSSSSESDSDESSVSEEETTSGEKKSKSTSESTTYSTSEESSSEEEEKVASSNKKSKSQPENHDMDSVIVKQAPSAPKQEPKRSNLDLLLELDVVDLAEPVMLPSHVEVAVLPSASAQKIQEVQPTSLDTKPVELLNRINGKGLSATYKYTRMPNIFKPSMVNMNLMFTNHTNEDITSIRMGMKHSDMPVIAFSPLAKLCPNCTLNGILSVDFCDSTKPFNFEITCSIGSFDVSVKPSIAELMTPVTMAETLFNEHQTKMQGMNEHTKTVALSNTDIPKTMAEICNLGVCPSSDTNVYRFSGKTKATSGLVLVTVNKTVNTIIVNCENPVFGSVLVNELATKLT